MSTIPTPRIGSVIRYSYLWHNEARTGQEEGIKDRPCSIILATNTGRVAVVPLTTSIPSSDTPALELPPAIARLVGLEEKTSWVIVDEVNVFKWPSSDIRRATKQSWAFGQLPPNYTKTILQAVRQQRDRLKTVQRKD